jgi:hypothetical protein
MQNDELKATSVHHSSFIVHRSGPGRGHEQSDANIRAIVQMGIGLAVLTIAALLLMWGLFRYFAASEAKSEPPPSPMAETRPLPPPPRLQVEPEIDLEHLRATEDEKLNAPPSWVNRQAGVVRIPIDRAMELIVERGLPVRLENATRGRGDAATRRAMSQGLPEEPGSGQTLERRNR